jgi:hypothetical protein
MVVPWVRGQPPWLLPDQVHRSSKKRVGARGENRRKPLEIHTLMQNAESRDLRQAGYQMAAPLRVQETASIGQRPIESRDESSRTVELRFKQTLPNSRSLHTVQPLSSRLGLLLHCSTLSGPS